MGTYPGYKFHMFVWTGSGRLPGTLRYNLIIIAHVISWLKNCTPVIIIIIVMYLSSVCSITGNQSVSFHFCSIFCILNLKERCHPTQSPQGVDFPYTWPTCSRMWRKTHTFCTRWLLSSYFCQSAHTLLYISDIHFLLHWRWNQWWFLGE